MKDRLIRRLAPSTAVVARWPLVPQALDGADWVLRRVDSRYAELPPASLRIRIGVSNRLLRNAHVYEMGQQVVRRFAERGWVHDGSRVLELGSGVGRNARALKDQMDVASYDGIDVDPQMVRWCADHLAGESMRFHHADLYSSVYNPGGVPVPTYLLPLADSSVDFSFGISVFSHLVSADAAHYAAELGRVMVPGGVAAHTFFLLDHIQGLLGDRWTFAHEAPGCRLENVAYPEAAVAFREADVAAMFLAQGLAMVEVLDKDLHQQTVVFRRMP